VTAIILAAGKSKRMGATVPKVLLPACGRPLLDHVIGSARAAGCGRVLVVVGAAGDAVRAEFADHGVEFVNQPEQRGTADAVIACRGFVDDDEECVVLCGDAPLVSPATIRRLARARREAGARVAVFTARPADPAGYGRIVRGPGDNIDRIVEERDARPEELAIGEVNSGAYAFRWGDVLPALLRIRPSATSGEYYLTDLVGELRAAGGAAVAVPADDAVEMAGANTPAQLAAIEAELARRGATTR
jgi:bifunctional UDP-N-acetylglucosamine pyrophosphorylase/glucosamine-1-phosphate N-acetyltransferase